MSLLKAARRLYFVYARLSQGLNALPGLGGRVVGNSCWRLFISAYARPFRPFRFREKSGTFWETVSLKSKVFRIEVPSISWVW